ncbi:hypothetical protein FH972_016706 [Carpinus fangiana]|uniref:Methyltransferase type 11 domain-containing protein n=1 Tax=Carpinus fangiana TaxID=176857 RepID=A0A5N6RGY8_9ROSI|nr:hypothetical protein FH972_016706 [Carpinus fangiana]
MLSILKKCFNSLLPRHPLKTLRGTSAPEAVRLLDLVDVVTIAQAFHWLDLPNFYEQVKWVLKKPNGVIAAWCYTVPEVNDSVDSVFQPYYKFIVRSWSSYQTVKEKDVELLSVDLIEKFKRAWTEDGQD